jgi:protein-S-isoprenylcysteine O-methyltransferase Ste14
LARTHGADARHRFWSDDNTVHTSSVSDGAKVSDKIVIVKPNEAFEVIWIAWLVSWMAASFWSGRTEKRAATRQTWIYRTAIFIGAILMAPWPAKFLADKRIWGIGSNGACGLLGVMLAGLLLTWLARIHLGRFWSSAITRKEHHRVVDTGPYAFVRHPIYTGIITALLATAVIQATAPALAGVALITYGLWLKARAEERFLMVELGPDSYGSYCRRVPMLIPFLPRR